jgi:hypothetical protein
VNEVTSNGPIHTRARWTRPNWTSTTAADRTARKFGWLRSSCKHVIGWAVVWRGHQWVIRWKSCSTARAAGVGEHSE